MKRLPAARFVVVVDATPPVNAIFVAMAVLLSKKLTVPPGVGPVEAGLVTTAVNVKGLPMTVVRSSSAEENAVTTRLVGLSRTNSLLAKIV